MKPMNKIAAEIAARAIEEAERLRIRPLSIGGATVVDVGLGVSGSFEAGLVVSKICMGGLADVSSQVFVADDLVLPAVAVSTDRPLEACMASQLAGWRIKVGNFLANGSGPARALARKPKKLFDAIGYSETSDEAVLVLETTQMPTEEVVKYIASEVKVEARNLYLFVVPPNSIAGSVQVSARVVETGIFKMNVLGFDVRAVKYGFGVCPVAPLHPNHIVMMGRTNDMLLYGSTTFYVVDCESDEELRKLVEAVPSAASKDYGKSFVELVKQFGEEVLYKVDPNVFAPAMVAINNARTGATFRAGRINTELVRRAAFSV